MSPLSLAPVVQKENDAIHWIHIYRRGNAIGFPNICLLDINLSGEKRPPTFN